MTMAALAGKLAAVYVQTDDAAVAITKEACTEDATHLRYQITATTKRLLDPATTVIVYGDNVEIAASNYTIEYAGGVIVFTVDPNVTALTVTGAYLQVAAGEGYFSWSLDPQMDTADTTEFGAAAKSFLATLSSFTGSAERFWYDQSNMVLLKAGTRIALRLYVDTSTGAEKWFECYAKLTGDSVTTPHDDVIKETINFQGDFGIYYRATA
jgi:hypothetical protein